MLEVKVIRADKERVLKGLKIKNFKNLALVDEILTLDDQRKQLQTDLNVVEAKSNKASKEIGKLFAQKKLCSKRKKK